MLKFFKKTKVKAVEQSDHHSAPQSAQAAPPTNNTAQQAEVATLKNDKNITIKPSTDTSWLQRLRQGLTKTRHGLGHNIGKILSTHNSIDADLFDHIETLLLSADVGIEATQSIMENLTQRLKRKQLRDPAALMQALREDLIHLLQPCEAPLIIPQQEKPYVILVIGVNGSGKTTTIGKLAKHFQQAGQHVLLAAGDTFRAAAIEQLQTWGKRHQVPVVAQHTGADSASVVFDALEAATARRCHIMLADTAGRLHTQQHLMAELQKVKRVLTKLDEQAPQEVLLVLDASIGQNALQQAKKFHEAIGVTGIVITKLDGTAKGGMLFAIAQQLQLPIRMIGVGEHGDDLHPFNAIEFVNALFDE